MKNRESTKPGSGHYRVAFFQRIFAHYQAGLVRELNEHAEHDYHFFGSDIDPLRTGIEPIPEELRNRIRFNVCQTVYWGKHLAFQWRAIHEALFGDFDVFILEGDFTIFSNWLAISAARIRGKHILLYTHGWTRLESGVKGWLRKYFYKSADGLLLYGNHAKKLGIAFGFHPEILYVAYNCLDDISIRPWQDCLTPQLRDTFRREWFESFFSRPLIISVGRLTSVKNYALLLHAVKLLDSQGCSANILLVGDGPEREGLEHMAKEMAVRLVCTGSNYSEEFLSVCFSAADLTVIPGAAGLTVIHSLSYGTPVIVHDDANNQVPESEAVKEGINGALFRSGDSEDLARSIMKVIRDLPRNPQVINQCRSVVDAAYTPQRMRVVFDDAVSKRPAINLNP